MLLAGEIDDPLHRRAAREIAGASPADRARRADIARRRDVAAHKVVDRARGERVGLELLVEECLRDVGQEAVYRQLDRRM